MLTHPKLCGTLSTNSLRPLFAAFLQLYVSPVKLVVGKGNLLSQIYRLLGLHGRFGSHGHHPSHQHPWLSGSSSGSTTAAAAAKEAAAAAVDDGAALEGLEVWSGPLRVLLEGPGRFRTERVDMLLGGWAAKCQGLQRLGGERWLRLALKGVVAQQGCARTRVVPGCAQTVAHSEPLAGATRCLVGWLPNATFETALREAPSAGLWYTPCMVPMHPAAGHCTCPDSPSACAC